MRRLGQLVRRGVVSESAGLDALVEGKRLNSKIANDIQLWQSSSRSKSHAAIRQLSNNLKKALAGFEKMNKSANLSCKIAS